MGHAPYQHFVRDKEAPLKSLKMTNIPHHFQEKE